MIEKDSNILQDVRKMMNKIYRDIPSDLLITLVWTISTFIFVISPILKDNTIRTIFGIPMVLFIPGYVTVAVLFPKRDDLEIIERIILSIGLSMAVVPLLGILLNYTFGIKFVPIVITLYIYATFMTVIATYRRNKLPENERLSVEFNRIYNNVTDGIRPKGRIDTILTVVLIFAVIIAVGMIYYVVTIHKGERFTEFYVLDKNGKSNNYDTELKVGEPAIYLVGVSNYEYAPVKYAVKIILDNDVLSSKEMTINHNESWKDIMEIIPDKEGTNMKLEFQLFKENNLKENNSTPYRSLHLWVNGTR